MWIKRRELEDLVRSKREMQQAYWDLQGEYTEMMIDLRLLRAENEKLRAEHVTWFSVGPEAKARRNPDGSLMTVDWGQG